MRFQLVVGIELIPEGGLQATMYKYDTEMLVSLAHWLQRGVRNPWQARGFTTEEHDQKDDDRGIRTLAPKDQISRDLSA
jgi:hypothetical protein